MGFVEWRYMAEGNKPTVDLLDLDKEKDEEKRRERTGGKPICDEWPRLS